LARCLILALIFAWMGAVIFLANGGAVKASSLMRTIAKSVETTGDTSENQLDTVPAQHQVARPDDGKDGKNISETSVCSVISVCSVLSTLNIANVTR